MTEQLAQLTGPMRAPQGGGKSAKLIVFLHGLGADGDDLIGLADQWVCSSFA